MNVEIPVFPIFTGNLYFLGNLCIFVWEELHKMQQIIVWKEGWWSCNLALAFFFIVFWPAEVQVCNMAQQFEDHEESIHVTDLFFSSWQHQQYLSCRYENRVTPTWRRIVRHTRRSWFCRLVWQIKFFNYQILRNMRRTKS